MNINDHREDFAEALHDAGSCWGSPECVCGGFANYLLASPALARLLAAARDEARAESATPADVLDGTGVTANTWQSAARRLADENRALIAAFDGLRWTLNEIRGGTR